MYRLRITSEDGTDYLNLLHGGLRIVNYAWQPGPRKWNQEYTMSMYGPAASSIGLEQPLTETFTLGFSGSADRQRAVVTQLKKIVDKLTIWHDGEPEDTYWLEWHTIGEVPKRALLYTGAWQPQSRQGSWPMLDNCVILGQLALVRHPLWEDVEPDYASLGVAQEISSLGGMIYLEDNPGTAPSRLAETIIESWTTAHTTALSKFWMGFRRIGDGMAQFVPVWEADEVATGGHGTIVDALDTITDADYSCSNCNRLQIDFANEEDLILRSYIRLQDVTATESHWKHFKGRYLVLCRCRCEDEDHAPFLQMRHGIVDPDYPDAARSIASEPVEIDNELYNLIPLGEIEIPPVGHWEWENKNLGVGCESSSFAIFLWASGEADFSLYIDCLVLIPTDFFLYVGDGSAGLDEEESVYYRTVVRVRPNETRVGMHGYLSGAKTCFYPRNSITPEPKRWYMPERNSMLVVAAQREDQHYFSCDPGDYVGTTDTLQIHFYSYPRWEEYRDDADDVVLST